MTTTARFEIFPDDLDATSTFYTSVLGFTLVGDERREPQGYLRMRRDGVQISTAYRPGPQDRASRRPLLASRS